MSKSCYVNSLLNFQIQKRSSRLFLAPSHELTVSNIKVHTTLYRLKHILRTQEEHFKFSKIDYTVNECVTGDAWMNNG